MTGLLNKKYHIAILDRNANILTEISTFLNLWYHGRVVVETYNDSYQMFEAVSVSKSKNKPFDIAIMSPEEVAEKMILKQTNPNLKVLTCTDANSLKTETSKILL